jgi:hypothetical protein
MESPVETVQAWVSLIVDAWLQFRTPAFNNATLEIERKVLTTTGPCTVAGRGEGIRGDLPGGREGMVYGPKLTSWLPDIPRMRGGVNITTDSGNQVRLHTNPQEMHRSAGRKYFA